MITIVLVVHARTAAVNHRGGAARPPVELASKAATRSPAILELQRAAGNRAVADAFRGSTRRPTVQRDLGVDTDDNPGAVGSVSAALEPLVKAKKVTEVRDGDTMMWGSTVTEAKSDVVAALRAKGFADAASMADAVFNRDNLVLLERDGESHQDTLSRQTDRPLTGAEREAASTVFWGSLDMDGVTISESRVIASFGYARTIPGHIYFPKGSFESYGFVPWLIHELTHVWQYQHGAPVGNVIVSAVRGHYDYGGDAGLRKAWADGDNFGDFGFEQQGDIMQHYYERVVGDGDTSAFEPFMAQVRAGRIHDRFREVKPIEPLPLATLDEHALQEQFRARIEKEIIAQLRLNPVGPKATLARRDRILELFHNFTGYWSGTYRDRLAARASNDELVTLLHQRMSRTTIAAISDILAGKAAPTKAKKAT